MHSKICAGHPYLRLQRRAHLNAGCIVRPEGSHRLSSSIWSQNCMMPARIGCVARRVGRVVCGRECCGYRLFRFQQADGARRACIFFPADCGNGGSLHRSLRSGRPVCATDQRYSWLDEVVRVSARQHLEKERVIQRFCSTERHSRHSWDAPRRHDEPRGDLRGPSANLAQLQGSSGPHPCAARDFGGRSQEWFDTAATELVWPCRHAKSQARGRLAIHAFTSEASQAIRRGPRRRCIGKAPAAT
jgi:hypothetical protein